MQPTTSVASPGLGLTPAAEAGVEQLWKFQLRKENAALLEKLNANEKLIRASAAEHDGKTEEALDRIAALEGKLLRLADTEKKEQELRESQARELEALRAQMRELGETSEASGRLLAQLKGEFIASNDAGNNGGDTGKAPAEVAVTASGASSASPSNNSLPSAVQRPRPRFGELPRPTSHRTAKAQYTYYGPPTTRSQRKLGEQSTQIVKPQSISTKPTASKPLTLRQRDGAFQAYLESTDRLYSSLPDAERPSDIEFVAMFIKGIRDSRGREKLSNKLQLLHPSRTKKDLSVEVICEWEDVLEAVKSMGKTSGGAGGSGKGGEGKGKRRRNILVPRELVDGGN